MAGTTITIDASAAVAGLSDLVNRLIDPAPLMREIGEVVWASTKQRFVTQTAPDGKRWAPNTALTLARYLGGRSGTARKDGTGLTKKGAKLSGNKKVLTDRGHLNDTLAYQVGADGRSVVIGSNRVYAAAQQFGMVKGYAGRTKRGAPIPWGDIPARPFLGLSTDDESRIDALLRRYLDNGR